MCELAASHSKQPLCCCQVIGGTANAALPVTALTVWPADVTRSIPRFAGGAGAEAAPSRLKASNRREDAGSHGPHRHGCVMTRQATFCGPGSWRRAGGCSLLCLGSGRPGSVHPRRPVADSAVDSLEVAPCACLATLTSFSLPGIACNSLISLLTAL